jgi:hypothetical protein
MSLSLASLSLTSRATAPASLSSALATLRKQYPALEPYDSGRLAVSSVEKEGVKHEIHWEWSGSKDGVPGELMSGGEASRASGQVDRAGGQGGRREREREREREGERERERSCCVLRLTRRPTLQQQPASEQ